MFALVQGEPIHYSGDKQLWDRKSNQVDLIGHAAVVQVGETLTANEIHIDFKTRVLIAKGNCVYNASESVIWGDQMQFNIDTRVGSVLSGRVSNNHFTLRGEVIHKLGAGHYQTRWGEYSTCMDCANSWSILAEDVDMQMEGYAFFKNVTPQIKNAPVFWFPYLFMPMKKQRQSGVLFPTFTLGGFNGATFVLPYFWAIDRSVDMTFGAGIYSARGARIEWEGRYALAEGSAIGKFSFVQDKNFNDQFQLGTARWGFAVNQTHSLPFEIKEKLSLAEVSDNYYPFYFTPDIMRPGSEVFLKSSLVFSRPSPFLNSYVSFERYRNLLNTTNLLNSDGTPNISVGNIKSQVSTFDPKTVQAYPRFGMTLPDVFLIRPNLVGGFSLNLVNFTRGAGAFDYDQSSVPYGTMTPSSAPLFRPGVDPIREAVRVAMMPSVYTTFRPWDRFALVPSLQYRGYLYQFGGGVRPLYRGYPIFQLDLSTQLEKIYDFSDDPKYPKAKHLMRPFLTYSFIPKSLIAANFNSLNLQSNHPFVQQSQINGYNFDDQDITPYTTSSSGIQYFVPLGNSLSYGFTSQWIRKKEGKTPLELPSYETTVELKMSQALNIVALMDDQNQGPKYPFTRFIGELNFHFEKWNSSTLYTYATDQPVSNPNVGVNKHWISTGINYVFEKALRQNILEYEKSISLNYSYRGFAPFDNSVSLTMAYSISDYLLPSVFVNYRFNLPNYPQIVAGNSVLLSAGAKLVIQSPSKCWKIVLTSAYSPGTGSLPTFVPDFSLNLVGSGFGGIFDFASQAAQLTGS